MYVGVADQQGRMDFPVRHEWDKRRNNLNIVDITKRESRRTTVVAGRAHDRRARMPILRFLSATFGGTFSACPLARQGWHGPLDASGPGRVNRP